MPRSSAFNPHVSAMPGAVYSPFADRLRDHPGPLFPLHVGDTWLEPAVGARMQDLLVEDHPGLHRYCDTRGLPDLVDAIVDKVRKKNDLPCERESVLVTAGATSGLSCVAGAIVRPGDEVLILAPFWPLIRGIVQTWGGVPVEVPFYDRVDTNADGAAVDRIVASVKECVTPRTVALYVSTPSNPTGRVLSPALLEGLAGLARAEDLWLLSDEVYEDFVYRGEQVSAAGFAPERSATFFSFSKAYGMAGNRVGYLAGPAALVDEARKIGTHSFYGAPTAGQTGALAALEVGAEWQRHAREQYRVVGDAAADALALPRPSGSTFFFMDVADRLDERGLDGFLADCFDLGVLVSPGASSGTDYPTWIRVCYTVMQPEDTIEGISRLARLLAS